MAGGQIPGPLGRIDKANTVEEGTLPRTDMHQPGAVGSAKLILPIIGMEEAIQLNCLRGQFDEMRRQTWLYLERDISWRSS